MHTTAPVREWLEADGLGGYAMGTAHLVRTRRYHAWLCTATTPPTGRLVLVAGGDVTLQLDGAAHALSAQHYAGGVTSPRGDAAVVRFTHEPWPTWEFALPGGHRVRQELLVRRGDSAVVLRWQLLTPAPVTAPLVVRPFLAGRDDHALRREHDGFTVTAVATDGAETVRWRASHGTPDLVAGGNGSYRAAPYWYRAFHYVEEAARGYAADEDLFAPGEFVFDLARGPAWLVLAAGALPAALAGGVEALQIACEHERQRRAALPGPLHRAGEAYLVARGRGSTIVAGYPWFTDWGRDTFIALRGLCLASGRLDAARQILGEWAGHVSAGMLPNRFPDHGGPVEYHTADAALWFVVAADEYLRTRHGTPDERRRLVEAVLAIVAGYAAGTRHGIVMDPLDGLLRAGEPGRQLTWMDAIVDGQVVTPRCGKPVELQALWINALAIAGRHDARWRPVQRRARDAFGQRFWSHRHGWLFDVVDVDHVPGRVDATLRPNQLLAVGGLPLALLAGARARTVVAVAERELLTPVGLRTLAAGEPGYAPVCAGGPAARDRAYHNGTVWPWLLGPFVEAWLRVHGATPARQAEAHARFVAPLLARAGEAGLGHVAEIHDGDAPHAPRGCPFQAWSVGELARLELRVLAGRHAAGDAAATAAAPSAA